MEVTDLLLCDRGQRINWVEPSVEVWMIDECLKARVLEIGRVFNPIDLLDECCPRWQSLVINVAEIVDVLVKVVGHGIIFISSRDVKRRVCEGSKRTEEEVPSMEARGYNDSIYNKNMRNKLSEVEKFRSFSWQNAVVLAPKN